MNAPSFDIKDVIAEDSALGLVYAKDLFIAYEPSDSEDGLTRTVTVYDTPGEPQQLTLDKSEVYEYPAIQIRVRTNAYTSGMSLAQDLVTLLHGTGNFVVNGALYTLVRATGSPVLLDWDEKRRPRFIINFNLQRRPKVI